MAPCLKGEGGLQQTGLDVGAAALRRLLVERGCHRLSCVEACREIDRQHLDSLRNPRRSAVDRHHSGIGLHHRVRRRLIAKRPLRTEARNRDIDDFRVGLPYALIIERELVELPDAKVLDENVTVAGEPLDDRDALGGLEIHGERALGAVDDDRMRRVIARPFAQPPAPAA